MSALYVLPDIMTWAPSACEALTRELISRCMRARHCAKLLDGAETHLSDRARRAFSHGASIKENGATALRHGSESDDVSGGAGNLGFPAAGAMSTGLVRALRRARLASPAVHPMFSAEERGHDLAARVATGGDEA
jgi:hypothetical protein